MLDEGCPKGVPSIWSHSLWPHPFKMRYVPVILILLCHAQPASPQQIAEGTASQIAWLQEHAIPLRTINPEDTNFVDLQPVADVLEKVRVVLLGEQSHGDGATFVAKHRFVRFLHQELGYRVLAFETNAEGLRTVDTGLHGDAPIATVAEPLYGIWGESEYVRPLLRYARETKSTTSPLTLAGFDIQVQTMYVDVYSQALRERMSFVAPDLMEATEYLRVDSIMSADGPVMRDTEGLSREDYATALQMVEALREQLSVATSGQETVTSAQLERLLDNMAWALRFNDHLAHGSTERATALRDEAMAENLVWLANRAFPGEKIVGWAHSYHIARSFSGIDVLDGSFSWQGVPMGAYVARELGDELYSVAFLAYDGEWGQIFPDTSFVSTLPEAPEGSLDWLLAQLDEPYVFLDLRVAPEDHWLRKKMVARPAYGDMSGVWPDSYDGVIFIRTMFPNRRMRPLGLR